MTGFLQEVIMKMKHLYFDATRNLKCFRRLMLMDENKTCTNKLHTATTSLKF